MRGMLIAGVGVLLTGCLSGAQRSDRLAEKAGFTRTLLLGSQFHHVAYERIAPGPRLLIFIDGDGNPWVHSGRLVAADPAAERPLGLELAVRSHTDSVLYLGRPCYLGLAATAECQSVYWTFRRYSPEVVQSLVSAASQFAAEHGFLDIVLIGHSGGGALAVLMAPHLPHVTAVLTIAANLNVRSWSEYHRYSPLTGSLDPALEPPLPAGIREIHLVGGADRNIPPALIAGYRATHPAAEVWTYPDFGHRCCWRDAWPTLLPKLLEALQYPAPAAAQRASGPASGWSGQPCGSGRSCGAVRID